MLQFLGKSRFSRAAAGENRVLRQAVGRPQCAASIVLPGLLVVLAGAAGCHRMEPVPDPAHVSEVGRPPTIRPDYSGIVLPPNIAPLNFIVDEPCTAAFVRITSQHGSPIDVRGRQGRIQIPIKSWHALLEGNRGEALRIEVFAREEGGRWTKFDRIENTIAEEPIDSHIVYRLMRPWYIFFRDMGIYQRDLESFDESAILVNTEAAGRSGTVCINCHTFPNNRPDAMTIHVRFPFVMVVARNGEVRAVDTRTGLNPAPFAYATWHPNGNLAVYSVNKIQQLFHTVDETRDVYDFTSDLLLYDFGENLVSTAPAISDPKQLETFPAWSADGRTLYFCRAPAADKPDLTRFRDVKYDLMRIAFDPETKTWGTPETVLSTKDIGLSVAMPRVSPDGRFLLFCMCEYGTFPVFQKSSDLFMLNLATGAYAPLACNSDKSESWHTWSSNSRWIAFSSKRHNGLLAKPYLAHIDAEGRAAKAFVMPQEDPAAYDSMIMTYSAPELVRGAVSYPRRALADCIRESEERCQQAAIAAETLFQPETIDDGYSSGYSEVKDE